MSLMRFVARSMFASLFMAEGVKAVTRPTDIASDAQAFTDKVVPLVQRVVPAQLSSYVPDKAETWVRCVGVAQVVGGAMFATGIGRRLGALLLTGSSVFTIATALPGKDASKAAKDAARPEVLRGVAMLGASVLATMDTQGRPSLTWRAEEAAKATGQKASALGADVKASARSAAKRTEKKAKKMARRARKQVKSINRKIGAAAS